MGHGDGAAMPRLHLRRHEATGAAGYMGARPGRLARKEMLVRGAMQPRGCADLHQRVIGGVEGDHIAARLRIVTKKTRRVLIGEPPELERLGATRPRTEGRKLRGSEAGPFPPHRLLQPLVRREQIHIDEGRALVEILLARADHGQDPGTPRNSLPSLTRGPLAARRNSAYTVSFNEHCGRIHRTRLSPPPSSWN